MRACLLATELARRAGLDRVRQGEVYYGTLLRFAGCAATSHEIAAAFGGDDIVVRARGDLIDLAVPAEAMRFLAGLGMDGDGLRVLGGVAGVARLKAEGARADCEVGATLAERLRLPEAVIGSIRDAFERFDGHGVPAGRAGDEITEPARFAAVGYAAVMFEAVAGEAAATETVARWSGRALDPATAAVFLDAPAELLRIEGGTVRPGLAEGVQHVGRGEQAGGPVQLGRADARRITGTVQPFVMAAGYLAERREQR